MNCELTITVLGYSNASKAVIMHVDEDDKLEMLVHLDSQNGNAGQRRKTTFISESGLYSLIRIDLCNASHRP